MTTKHIAERRETSREEPMQGPLAVDRSARNIVQVNPFRCRVWAMHDRLSDYVTENSCKAEIESFARHGQLIPALGRRLTDDSEWQVEIIYGVRRLFVAQHLNVPLQVELRDLSDMEALVAMDIENRLRRDISPYERGINYASWLRKDYFSSQDDLARVLKVSSSQISRLLKLAQLPSVVVRAFASPLDIREGWGIPLLRKWQDPEMRSLIGQRARKLASQSRPARAEEVYTYLMAPAGTGARARKVPHDVVVLGAKGTPLFRVRRQRNTVALLLPSSRLSESQLDRISQTVREVLENSPQ